MDNEFNFEPCHSDMKSADNSCYTLNNDAVTVTARPCVSENNNKIQVNLVNMTADEKKKFLLRQAKLSDDAYDVEQFLNEMDAGRIAHHILVPKIRGVYTNNKDMVKIVWDIKFGSDSYEETVVRTHNGEKFDLEKGIAVAISTYVFGNNFKARDTLKKVITSAKCGTESAIVESTFNPTTELSGEETK